ncbi:MAG: 50S ribosomal protein L22 [bacterium]
MEVKAKLNNLRIGPRKVRLVADLIRGMNAHDAISQLKYLNKKSSVSMIKLIESAMANGENNVNLKRSDLYIKAITVDEGITIKRWMPKAFGRAGKIRKRGSIVNIVLEEKQGLKVNDKKAKGQAGKERISTNV